VDDPPRPHCGSVHNILDCRHVLPQLRVSGITCQEFVPKQVFLLRARKLSHNDAHSEKYFSQTFSHDHDAYLEYCEKAQVLVPFYFFSHELSCI
jgi:hypothetical protein